MVRRGRYFLTRRWGGCAGKMNPVLGIFVCETTNTPLARELHSLEEKYIPGSQRQRGGS